MFKEKRIVYFEELEPTSHKKKERKSEFFEHQVEIKNGKTDSVDKEKKVSEHKEILTIKQFQSIKAKEEDDKKEEQKNAQKLMEELNLEKCPKCESTNVKKLKDENFLECIDCKYKWLPKES